MTVTFSGSINVYLGLTNFGRTLSDTGRGVIVFLTCHAHIGVCLEGVELGVEGCIVALKGLWREGLETSRYEVCGRVLNDEREGK